jgi:hypothetical protein
MAPSCFIEKFLILSDVYYICRVYVSPGSICQTEWTAEESSMKLAVNELVYMRDRYAIFCQKACLRSSKVIMQSFVSSRSVAISLTFLLFDK